MGIKTYMKQVSVIGMGLTPEDLTAKHLKLIKDADILVGGKRHLEYFNDHAADKKEISKDLEGVIRYIKSRMRKKNVVVLASGDPLFFGIGSLLIKSLGPDNVVIYPNISTVAAAFSKIKESWNDISVVSLHGRNRERELFSILDRNKSVAVYTDSQKNPAWLAGRLLEKGIKDIRMCIFEQLGTESECFDWYEPGQAADMNFSQPNLIVLKPHPFQPEGNKELHLGMPDNRYEYQKGLITKSEIRAITISRLCLSSDHILWDLGAGSGSISIEASLFIKKGKIFSLEQNPSRINNIKANKKQYSVKNLKVVQAVLPNGLEDLPEPDRIFIGGGGRNLVKIIDTASEYLKPDGVMVVNTVILSNVEAALKTLKSKGFKTDIVLVQIHRGQDMPWGERLEALNPVWIISARTY
jgi:precorrin-6B C5,15-methyltransferase / cobalt-precorrin-6B C5,C15-methyltransferase